MSHLWVIVLSGIGTYLIRLSMVVLAGRLPEPSPDTLATLRLIAPSVLAAIVADRLFVTDGALGARWDWVAASVVAGWAAWRFRSAAVAMAVGMLAVWAIAFVG